MLTWPALAYARAALPKTRIDVLVSPAVEEIAQACPYVDQVIVDNGVPKADVKRHLRSGHYDAAVALFSTARVAHLLWAAGIPYRLGPATKWHQMLLNSRLRQRRSASVKPEYEYNLDLIFRLLDDYGIEHPAAAIEAPYWHLRAEELEEVSVVLRKTYYIPKAATLIVVHPGSGGSARNLSIEQYAKLIDGLQSSQATFVLVTAGPGEGDQASLLSQQITAHQAAVYRSTDGLVAFSQVLALANLFISGSTGPLHIAGALDVPTVAFYPRRRSSTALRWQTTNRAENRLAFSPPASADEQDMRSINVANAAQEASLQFLGVSRG
jgi:ADP-heptose:LPS heptosyltransferase